MSAQRLLRGACLALERRRERIKISRGARPLSISLLSLSSQPLSVSLSQSARCLNYARWKETHATTSSSCLLRSSSSHRLIISSLSGTPPSVSLSLCHQTVLLCFYGYVTLEHKTSHKRQFDKFQIYASSES